jgi:hypothetical protein
LKQGSRQGLEAAQKKFLRALLRVKTLDKIRNTEIRKKLNVKNIV